MTESANRLAQCERCGFVPKHMCQLDVVHLEGSCESNDLSNYMTLCLNCQRIKGAMNRDHLAPAGREALEEAWRWGYLLIKTKSYPGWGPGLLCGGTRCRPRREPQFLNRFGFKQKGEARICNDIEMRYD